MANRSFLRTLALATCAALAGCAQERIRPPEPRPADVRAQIAQLMPTKPADRNAWAADIYVAFQSLDVEPSTQNLCATLSVIEQESNFSVDPAVPNLGKIARAEIDKRAEAHHIPQLVVRAALSLTSPNGKRYDERIAGARTERDLSRVYEDMIGELPLGQRLFADSNPVHTAGPMQVSVAFAEQFARDHTYPYATHETVRHELFSRRGGVYYGVAHLLAYPTDYPALTFRFADFNAGWYASRNAAFQKAASLASGIPLALDGDLVLYDKGSELSATERAVQTLAKRLDLSNSQIHRALEQGEEEEFGRSKVYLRVFDLADAQAGKALPRAVLPKISLHSPKITRQLTTEWFATRVDQRYQSCLARAAPAHK